MTRPFRILVAALAALLAAPAAQAAEGGLSLVPDWSQLLVMLVAFTALVPVLNALVFQPLLGVLDERDRRIDGARTRAATLARESADLLARHEAALREARESANADRTREVDEARRAHQQAVAAARSAAEQQIAATRTDVTDAVARARAELRSGAEPLAREVAERLLGRTLS